MLSNALSFWKNQIIQGTLFSFIIAQFLKVVFSSIRNRRLDWSYTLSMSGMPSGHTTGITALATYIGIVEGFKSQLFALAFGIALVVMYDAMGVRRQAGKHAELLNYLLDKYTIFSDEEEDSKRYLAERLGHTPWQVLGGLVTGVSTAFLFAYWFII